MCWLYGCWCDTFDDDEEDDVGDACSTCGGRGTVWDRATKTNKICWSCKGRGAPLPRDAERSI